MKYVCCQEEENMIKLLKNWTRQPTLHGQQEEALYRKKSEKSTKILIWINNDQNHPGELPEE